MKNLGSSVERLLDVRVDVIRRHVFANYPCIENKIKLRINNSFCVTKERVFYFLRVT
jgi:hypothetical protein